MPPDRTDPFQLLGARIRSRRHELGLSLESAAPLCGIHWSALGHLERGTRKMSIMTLLKIADGLSIDAGELTAGLHAP